ncbi:MAG: hypothetical protein AAFQ05_08365, partial [Pseudomonadota bacterium]
MSNLGFLYKLAVTLTRQQKRYIILTIDVALILIAYLLARGLILANGLTDGAPWSLTLPLLTDLVA